MANEEIADILKEEEDFSTEIEEVTKPSEDTTAPKTEEQLKEAEVSSDSFTDASKLPPELQTIYKQMQADYTRKTQAIANTRHKSELYDEIIHDPASWLKQMGIIKDTPQSQPSLPVASPSNLFEGLDLEDPAVNAISRVYKAFDDRLSKQEQTYQETVTKNQQEQFFGTLKTNFEEFQKSKPDITNDKELIRTMDMIGMKTPELYSDLAKLHRVAEAYLGRTPSTEEIQKTIQKVEGKVASAKKAPEAKVTGTGKIALAKSIAEAFEQALGQMKE